LNSLFIKFGIKSKSYNIIRIFNNVFLDPVIILYFHQTWNCKSNKSSYFGPLDK